MAKGCSTWCYASLMKMWKHPKQGAIIYRLLDFLTAMQVSSPSTSLRRQAGDKPNPERLWALLFGYLQNSPGHGLRKPSLGGPANRTRWTHRSFLSPASLWFHEPMHLWWVNLAAEPNSPSCSGILCSPGHPTAGIYPTALQIASADPRRSQLLLQQVHIDPSASTGAGAMQKNDTISFWRKINAEKPCSKETLVITC